MSSQDTKDSLFHEIGETVEATARRNTNNTEQSTGNEISAETKTNDQGATDASTAHDQEENDMRNGVSSIPSLCMQCEETGVTNILFTKIPFFRDVILMAFYCKHCGFRNSEVQEAEYQEKGCRFTCTLDKPEDLSRQVIKSSRATIHVPELDLEIPSITQQGVFTTIEGLLMKTADNLEAGQAVRRSVDAESAAKVDDFIVKLREYVAGEHLPFTLILDDPAGNSFVENPLAPKKDPNLKVMYYTRSNEQNKELGLVAENASSEGYTTEEGHKQAATAAGAQGSGHISSSGEYEGSSTFFVGSKAGKLGGMIHEATDRAKATDQRRTPETKEAANSSEARARAQYEGGQLKGLFFDSSREDAMKEVMRFPVNCYNCGAAGETRMCVTDVPHFKEIIIMSFSCEECGWHNVEVKGGGAVPDHGQILTLKMTPGEEMEMDFRRDVIKSDTAAIVIPEIELELEHGTLGGMYTTVEGLLTSIKEKLVESNPFAYSSGDSAVAERKSKFAEFLHKYDELCAGKMGFTLRLVDPMANSFIYSPYHDIERGVLGEDPRLLKEDYTRSRQEDLELGLLDMKTEDYSNGGLQTVQEDAAEEQEDDVEKA